MESMRLDSTALTEKIDSVAPSAMLIDAKHVDVALDVDLVAEEWNCDKRFVVVGMVV